MIFGKSILELFVGKVVAGALPLREWRAAPPPIRHGVLSPLCTTIKPASPSPSLDGYAAGTRNVPFILSPCNLTSASLSPPRPRSSRLLRRLGPLLGVPITLFKHPNYDLSPPLNPTLIHTIVAASYTHSPSPLITPSSSAAWPSGSRR